MNIINAYNAKFKENFRDNYIKEIINNSCKIEEINETCYIDYGQNFDNYF